MPLFGQKRSSSNNERKKYGVLQNSIPTDHNVYDSPPLLPLPPVLDTKNAMAMKPHPPAVMPSRKDLLFHSQLAHGSSIKVVNDFSNVKELYQKISEVFGLGPNEQIIFCTLNTHKIDMSRLLGAQIALGDFIFAHVKGPSKLVMVNKTDGSLGLTITDNGMGLPFIKRVKEGSIVSQMSEVCVGDMIESINGCSMLQHRHYEVAKVLKELPEFTKITLNLIEPKKGFDVIGPRLKGGASTASVLEGDPHRLEQALASGEGRATLKMKRDGQAVVEEVREWESRAAEEVDDMLETFMGIRDIELSQTMVDLTKGKTDLVEFVAAMQDQLGEFEFPDEFVNDVWTAVAVIEGTSH